ncbi:hypothetical protein [Fructilactobacillus florum]|uniref:hypothetical protein n=1 Tax=Fructilactobacillus florum TaxID=640331 RepID=UPI0006CF8DF9|nr:hypothetical protein [Fructilactobacillus florum]
MEPTACQAFQFMLLDDHEVVIYGVLKRLNIRPFQQQYDDLAQEGRLAFVCAYQKYPHERENHPKMMNYIYQAVYWKLLDVLRQKTRQTAKISGGG